MAKYKVKDGHKFGNVRAGEIVELSKEEAAPHLRHLDKVSDFRNEANIVVAPEHKFLTAEDKPNYAALTVNQLREELATRGLETGGVKADLVARLEESDEAEQ